MGFVGAAQAERHPDVALGVRLGGEGELMPLRVTPVVAERLIAVRHAVAVQVADAGDLAEGRREHRAVAPCEREDLVLTGGEEVVFRLGGRGEGAGDEVDVTAARADRQPPVG